MRLWMMALMFGLFAGVPNAHADAGSVYYSFGKLNLTVPWDNVNAVYLYDFVGKQNLIGGEAVIANAWRVDGTFGAVTSIDGRGTPFIGANLNLDNPVAQHFNMGPIKFGVFGGYDFNRGAAIGGAKASINIFG